MLKKYLYTHKLTCNTAAYLLTKIISQQQLQIKCIKGQYALSLISIHIQRKVENRQQPDGNVDSSPVYIDSSGTSKCGAGNARSIDIKSSEVSSHPVPPLFSCTCSGRPAFGMVKTDGWRVKKLSATCLGVRPCRFAISASSLPPVLWGGGKLRCPNGEYPTTAIPRFAQ